MATEEVFTVSEGSTTTAVPTPASHVTVPVSTPGNTVIPGSGEVTTPGSNTTCEAQNVVSFIPLNSGNEYQESNRVSSSSERASTGNSSNPVTSDVFISRFPGKAQLDYSKVFSTMVSGFKLLRNQPFSFSVGLFEAPKDWVDLVSANESTLFTSSNKYQIPTSDRFDTCCFIEWGGFMLALYRKTNNISLFKATSSGSFELVDTKNIPAATNPDVEAFVGMHLVIYPIGNQIIVYDGSRAGGVEGSRYNAGAAIFDLGQTVVTGEGPIAVTTYLGAANYRYNHVLHVASGTFTSPRVTPQTIGTLAFGVDYEGKVGVGTDIVTGETGTFSYKVPDPTNGTDLYTFLSNTSIDSNVTRKTIQNGKLQISYSVTLKSNTTSTNRFCMSYSPRIYVVSMRINPNGRRVNLQPDPQIDNNDVISIQVTQTMEGSTASVVLNNRKLASSTIPTSGGKYDRGNFVGVKPLTIRYGVDKDEIAPIVTKFTGYITNRSFNRAGKGAQSTITLQCEDVSIKAKTVPGINLPIFDGWCHLGAMYFLAREAGYDEDEIVLGRNADLLKNSVEGDTVNFTGGCFGGHAGNPANVDLTTHLILPLPAFKDNPRYMFQMGTPIWDCMNEIREFTGYCLYGDKNGKLVYGPLGAQFKNTGKKYYEIAGGTGVPGQYDEIQRELTIKHNHMETRNGSIAMGYIIPAASGGDEVEQPIIHVIKDEQWPENVSNEAYVPWQRYVFVRNPLWNNLQRLVSNNIERFKRAKRPRISIGWTSWGQTKLEPYDQISIDEQQGDETGINTKIDQVVITSTTDNLDATSKSFFTTFEADVFNPTDFDYSPHV